MISVPSSVISGGIWDAGAMFLETLVKAHVAQGFTNTLRRAIH